MTLTRSIGTRTIVVSSIGLIVASAVVAVVVLTSRPTSSGHGSQSLASSSSTSDSGHGSDDMPGMAPDPAHGSDDMPATTPTTDSHGSDDMPGMAPDPAHGSDDMPGARPDTSGHSDVPGTSPGHGISEAGIDRPLAPVLGTFGGGASAVMLTAGFLRRRDKARAAAKQAARAARKAQS